MKYIHLLFGFILSSTVLLAQVPLESISSDIVKNGSRYLVRNNIIQINQEIQPIEDAVILMRNGGGLRFLSNAKARFGRVKRDGGGNVVYDEKGLPIIESRVMIIEESNAASVGFDNYNNNNCRFQSGCEVSFEGVTYLNKTSSRSDFDIRSGAKVSFYNSEVIVSFGTNSFTHFGSNQVIIDGLKVGNNINPTALEFTTNGVPQILKNLEIIDGNPGSNHRHLVFINNPANTYNLDNLRARNIVSYEGNPLTINLNNPLSNIPKSTQNDNGNIFVYRDLDIQAVNQNGSAAQGIKLYIRRKNGSTPFDLNTNLDVNGEYTQRLEQYRMVHNSFTQQQNNQYDIFLLDYNKQLYYNDFTLDFVSGLNGRNELKNLFLLDDPNITKNASGASGITGVSIFHNPSTNGGTISITDSVSLCDVYDFIKYQKVTDNNNVLEPSPANLAVTINGGGLNIGAYQLVINSNGKLVSCDKFQELVSSVNSSIADPQNNLEISFTDPNGMYRLIELQNLDTANVVITDLSTNTVLFTQTGAYGSLRFVSQTNSSQLNILATKPGYTNWAHTLDANSSNRFRFIVNQAELTGALGNPALYEKQEELAYLLQKILLKNQVIQSNLGNTNLPTLNVNSVNQSNTTFATIEKQNELIEILHKILAKTTLIENYVEKD
jgi:hypothetical protein